MEKLEDSVIKDRILQVILGTRRNKVVWEVNITGDLEAIAEIFDRSGKTVMPVTLRKFSFENGVDDYGIVVGNGWEQGGFIYGRIKPSFKPLTKFGAYLFGDYTLFGDNLK